MIFELIIRFFIVLAGGILYLLPNFDLTTTQIDSALTWVFTNLSVLNGLLPISELLTVLGIIFAFESAMLIFRLGQWIMNYIRGTNNSL